MKRIVVIVAGLLVASTSAFAQTPDADALDRALAPAPRNQKEAATVIKWKADNTYDTLKKGTNKLVCYERTGDPGITAPFAAQCTSSFFPRCPSIASKKATSSASFGASNLTGIWT